MRTLLGYCTNVHAGGDLQQMKSQLEEHATQVRRRFAGDGDMGIGLWFSATSAAELMQLAGGDSPESFAAWLAERQLIPFTLNGFPFGDFHQAVVKHRVYHPMWGTRERSEYTRTLIAILDAILPRGQRGSISTLPIGWGLGPDGSRDHAASSAPLDRAAKELLEIAAELARLEDATGRHISLCLEPEPGCLLQTSRDVIDFFQQRLFSRGSLERTARYIQVCHDTCHASVMFEDQVEVLGRYRDAGIHVGKVQISSAIRVPFEEMNAADKVTAWKQLHRFAEDRYLHQTCWRPDGSAPVMLVEDLPRILSTYSPAALPRGEWRIHFHVPLFLESIDKLHTTSADTAECLRCLRSQASTQHFEVETYAWNVLPRDWQAASLAEGIAAEMAWAKSHLQLHATD